MDIDRMHGHAGAVLVVDDNVTNRNLLSRILSAEGYEVWLAHDGESTLETLTQQVPDVILLDVQMPGMNGFEVCRRVLQDERTRDVPVIFISALTDTESIVMGFDSGGVDYITKPFRRKEVLARVATHLALVRHRREIEALHRRDRLHYERLSEMRSQFVRQATHDLKNPLNIILGYSELIAMLSQHNPDPQVLEAVQYIHRGVEKMRGLITDMLDLAQVEMGMSFSKVPISLAEVLERAVGNFTMLAEDKQLALVFRPPVPDVTVAIDQNRFERVLDNLLSNAIKYTPSGGRVEIEVGCAERVATIAIKDTGLGIPAEDLEHLFNPFYRVKSKQHRAIEGTGLGLTIVKTIVEQHGGDIAVRSQEGEGSLFVITLPVVD